MKHGVAGYKLKRDASARRALLRNLATSVIDAERIQTTIPKAKAIKPIVEKLITLGKKDNLAARRQAASFLMTPEPVKAPALQPAQRRLHPHCSPRLAQGRRRRNLHAGAGGLRTGEARRRAPQTQGRAPEAVAGRARRHAAATVSSGHRTVWFVSCARMLLKGLPSLTSFFTYCWRPFRV